MIIISHRGYWLNAEEKNKTIAFQRSFDLNFGTETDVRDHIGQLVISHDMPIGNELTLEECLAFAHENKPLLAINIKSDGLAIALKTAMEGYGRSNWFAFDMSIPDMRSHITAGNPVFARLSDVEKDYVWFDQIEGIWLDSFTDEWYDKNTIQELLDKNKSVCIVSSELHGREHAHLWEMLKSFKNRNEVILCTDYPERAKDYFYGVKE